jgi:hypothetical protein
MRVGMTKAVVLLTMDADDVARIAVPNPSIASRKNSSQNQALERD